MVNVTSTLDVAKLRGATHTKMQEALLETMLALEGHAKRLAPVDTGRLRASIHTTPKRPADTIRVGDGVEYGVYQEYGTSRVSAQPYLRPATDIAFKLDFPAIAKRILKE